MAGAQRDNGGCPGKQGRDGCSGLHQSTWQFSHIFEPFSRGWQGGRGPGRGST